MRAYAERLPIGSTFVGGQIALYVSNIIFTHYIIKSLILNRIIESKNVKYATGKYILAFFGWRDYTISNGEAPPYVNFPPPQILPDFHGLPLSLGLGVLGRPGYMLQKIKKLL